MNIDEAGAPQDRCRRPHCNLPVYRDGLCEPCWEIGRDEVERPALSTIGQSPEQVERRQRLFESGWEAAELARAREARFDRALGEGRR